MQLTPIGVYRPYAFVHARRQLASIAHNRLNTQSPAYIEEQPKMHDIIGASRSEPHTSDVNRDFPFIYIYLPSVRHSVYTCLLFQRYTIFLPLRACAYDVGTRYGSTEH